MVPFVALGHHEAEPDMAHHAPKSKAALSGIKDEAELQRSDIRHPTVQSRSRLSFATLGMKGRTNLRPSVFPTPRCTVLRLSAGPVSVASRVRNLGTSIAPIAVT